MNREAGKADHLKRIELGIRRVEKGGSPGREETAAPFTFIFGVGTDGLSPLEMILQGRGVGDVVEVTIPAEGVEYVFGQLTPPPAVRKLGPGDESADHGPWSGSGRSAGDHSGHGRDRRVRVRLLRSLRSGGP